MANFTPTLAPIHEKSPFRFWCQKVLPTVYDDSLSYYELLTKVVYYLNENTQDLETVNSNVEALYNAYVELQNYVNNYFDQNFPELVAQRLDEMVEDGTFDAMLRAIVDPYFEEKSEEIDDTLQEQNDYITWLRNQWNLFINSSAGLPNERTLWSGRMYVEDSVIDLNYSYEDYDYLEFYLSISNNIVPVIFRVNAADIQSKSNGAWLNYALPSVNEQNAGTLIVITFNIQRVLSDPEDLTSVDYTKLKLVVNADWTWTGQSSSNATLFHNAQAEDPLYNLEMISKIVGIRAVQFDNEIIDARTGYNGTVYQTLGQAIRTQVDDIYDELDMGGGLSQSAKNALLACFQNVAWRNTNGNTYYTALENALNALTVRYITATFEQGDAEFYPSDSLDSLKPYLTVIAYYDNGSSENVTSMCTLSGTLIVGTSTITATYQDKSATFEVEVSEVSVVSVEVEGNDKSLNESAATGTSYAGCKKTNAYRFRTVNPVAVSRGDIIRWSATNIGGDTLGAYFLWFDANQNYTRVHSSTWDNTGSFTVNNDYPYVGIIFSTRTSQSNINSGVLTVTVERG